MYTQKISPINTLILGYLIKLLYNIYKKVTIIIITLRFRYKKILLILS